MGAAPPPPRSGALQQNRGGHVCDRKFAPWLSRLKATFLLHCAPLSFDTSLCQTFFVFVSTHAAEQSEAKRGVDRKTKKV